MSTEELIKTIKSSCRRLDIISYRQAFTLVMYKRGVPGVEIARLLGTEESIVHKTLRVTCDRLEKRDEYVDAAYHEILQHRLTVVTENAEKEVSVGPSKILCKSITIDGVNFEE